MPVAVVASRTEADLIVGLLRSNGLRAAVSADDAAGLEPQLQLQGVRVLVAPSDEASARRLLADADLLDRSGRVDAVSAWSPSSLACTTPPSVAKKLLICAATISSASPRTAGARLS